MADGGEKPARGTYGDGTVRTRPDGRMEKRIYLGTDPATGKRVRKSAYGYTLKELQRNAKKLEARWRAGLTVDAADRVTLGEHFENWLTRKAVELEERTIRNYRADFERYVSPALGGLRVDPQVLTDERVEAWHTNLAGERSAYTANRALALLANVLNGHKVMRRSNPAKAVPNAKHEKDPVEILSSEELGVFLPATRRTRLQHMFGIALSTGLRHGEAAALHWRDVKFYRRRAANGDYGELHVHRAVVLDKDGKRVLGRPKSKSAIRTIGLMQEAAEALELQADLLRAEGLASSPVVFPNAAGGLQDETNTARALRGVIDSCNPRLADWMRARCELLRQGGVESRRARQLAWAEVQALPTFRDLVDVKYVSFHDLRHTFASMMIAAGMDGPTLSVVLGHADVATTMRLYVHLFELQQRRGMPSISQFVPSLEPIRGQNWGSALERERSK